MSVLKIGQQIKYLTVFFASLLLSMAYGAGEAASADEASHGPSRGVATVSDAGAAYAPPPKRVKKSASAPSRLSAPSRFGSYPPAGSIGQTFLSILAHAPDEPPLVVPSMGAAHEQEEGSRRFVKGFPGSVAMDSWHQEAMKDVNIFCRAATIGPKAPAPKHVNVALARILFFKKDGGILNQKELPYFFVSGWPANANRTGFEKLSNTIIPGLAAQREKYGIRLITAEYIRGEERVFCGQSYDFFFKEMHDLMRKEERTDSKILGGFRLRAHVKLTEPSDQYPIQAILYFHSEQAMRSAILESVEKQIKAQLAAPSFAIVDICSYYDMCWGCGDVLSAGSHTDAFTIPVYFHASGEKPYFDRPFNELGTHMALRHDRHQFPGYEKREAYTKAPDLHKPYIAHVTQEDHRAA